MSGSRWAVIRQNIEQAIKQLPLYDGTPVFQVGIPADLFNSQADTAIGVCVADDTWLDYDKGLSSYLDREAEMDIPIGIYNHSTASAAGVFMEDGAIDDLSALLLGTTAGPKKGPGIRSVDVGVPGETGGVYLRAIKSQVIPGPKRAEGSGGPLVKVILFRTTSVPL